MRNIVNIIKYDLRGQRTPLIIQGGIILFFVLQSLIGGSWITSEVKFVPIISILLVINFITSIVKFIKGINLEEGRLLFLAPIKGWEFIVAKYFEFIGMELAVVILSMVGVIITGGNATVILIVGASIILGLMVLFALITSFSIIYNSYFSKRYISIILTVISMALFGIVISILQILAYLILPSIYIIIGEVIEVNILNIILNFTAFILLIFAAVYHIDKKLDIV